MTMPTMGSSAQEPSAWSSISTVRNDMPTDNVQVFLGENQCASANMVLTEMGN